MLGNKPPLDAGVAEEATTFPSDMKPATAVANLMWLRMAKYEAARDVPVEGEQDRERRRRRVIPLNKIEGFGGINKQHIIKSIFNPAGNKKFKFP